MFLVQQVLLSNQVASIHTISDSRKSRFFCAYLKCLLCATSVLKCSKMPTIRSFRTSKNRKIICI